VRLSSALEALYPEGLDLDTVPLQSLGALKEWLRERGIKASGYDQKGTCFMPRRPHSESTFIEHKSYDSVGKLKGRLDSQQNGSLISRLHSTSTVRAVTARGDYLSGLSPLKAFLREHIAAPPLRAPTRQAHHRDEPPPPTHTDYDVVVVGGGSGGISLAREAAALGARVCLLDLVKPSWQGTVGGGSCWVLGVN
jgi:hypothetical protein